MLGRASARRQDEAGGVAKLRAARALIHVYIRVLSRATLSIRYAIVTYRLTHDSKSNRVCTCIRGTIAAVESVLWRR